MNILSTQEYEKFKLFECNREIDDRHVLKLMKQIEIKNDLHLHPIIVDKQMRVIDGQHRLESARRLNLPIYYVIDENGDTSDIISLNTTQKKWSNEDYLNYYVSKGFEDYCKLKELCSTYNWIWRIGVIWCGKNTCLKHYDFKSGKFRFLFTDENKENLIIFLKIKETIKDEIILNSVHFHRAIRQMLMSPIFDKIRLIEQCKKAEHLFRAFPTTYDYLTLLCHIYGYHDREYHYSVARLGKTSEYGFLKTPKKKKHYEDLI